MARQQRLANFTEWLEHAGYRSSGFVGGIRSTPYEDRLSLVWKNISPVAERAVRREARERGITVEFVGTDFDVADLLALNRRLEAHAAELRARGVEFMGVSGMPAAHPHRPSINIRMLGTAKRTEASPDVLVAHLHALAGASLPVQQVDRRPKAGNRYWPSPSAPAGGSFIRNVYPPQYTCSTGFSLIALGVAHATTARHCGNVHGTHAAGPSFQTDAPGGNLGRPFLESKVAGAYILQGGGGAKAYDGDWRGTRERRVERFQSVNVGDYVCTSGASSGSWCGLVVDDLWELWNDGYGTIATIMAHTTDTPIAVAEGDSGGLVYTNITGYGDGPMGAAGMIQWGEGDVPCPRLVPERPVTGCATRVGFSSMEVMANEASIALRSRVSLATS